MRTNTAIVIGYKGTNSTGLIRSLGEAGYRVVFASSYSRIESKYTADYLFLPENEKERLDVLCDYVKALPEKAAILTGDDNNTAFLEKYHDILSQYCYCPGAKGKLHEISDKSVMAQIAVKVGLRIPNTYIVDVSEDTICPTDYPIIMKPYAGYAGSKSDIRICRNRVAFESSLRHLHSNGYTRVVLQQLLESEDLQDICIMGCSFENGDVRIPCAIRKIRSYPLKQGSLSFGKVDNKLLEVCRDQLKQFVKKTGYVGVFDIDMMISNGILYFIEINYRNGQNGYVSTKAGYNIPDNWIRGMQGKQVDAEKPMAELYYMDEKSDYKHISDGNVSLSDWLREMSKVSVFAMYCPGDMRPFWRQYIRIPEKWKRKLKKAGRSKL